VIFFCCKKSLSAPRNPCDCFTFVRKDRGFFCHCEKIFNRAKPAYPRKWKAK